MYNILICDDEKDIVNALEIYLGTGDYKIFKAYNGKEALDILATQEIHLVLMDIMMPQMDGIEALEKIRQQYNMPVIMLSAKSEDVDKINGLNLGADDYITKPFGAGELLARIRTAIRHTRTGLANETIATTGKFKAGDLEIDYDKHQVLVNGVNANLTQNEYKIIGLLGKCAGKVLTYDYIIKELWGPGTKGNNQSLRVHMANIRRKIEKNPAEPQYIFTEIGVGYRMVEGD